jgi:site-specific recombinase XerD
MTSDDVSRLLAAVEQGSPRWRDRDLAVIQVFVGSGLKLSELTALRLSDVRLETPEPCLHARDAAGEPDRIVPLDEEPHSALVAYLPTRQAAPGVEHFFVNRDGNPLSTRSIQRLLSHYGQEAGLPGLTTQALRYQYARRIYESHADLKLVSSLLGHRHVATTIRYLRPTSPEEERPPFPGKQDGDSVGNPDES